MLVGKVQSNEETEDSLLELRRCIIAGPANNAPGRV